MTNLYNDFLSKVSISLEKMGFEPSKDKHSLQKQIADFSLVVEPQKSTRKDWPVRVTANIMINVKEFSKELDKLGFSSLASAQYKVRIGRIKYDDDHWWDILDMDGIDLAVNEIIEILNCASMTMPQNRSQLVTLWKKGVSPGLTAAQRNICLAIYYYLYDRDNMNELQTRLIMESTSGQSGVHLALSVIRKLS